MRGIAAGQGTHLVEFCPFRPKKQGPRVATLTPPSRNPLHSTAKPAEGEFQPYKERTDAKGTKVREVKSFEEAMSEAMSDDDVLKSALSSASFGPAQ